MSRYALEQNGSTCLWVAPTYRQALIAFRLMARALQPVLAADPNKSEMRLELVNQSTVQFASAERYNNLRGEGVSFLVMDEVGQIIEEAWTEALRPTLSDTNGRVIFIGTPRGRNWFWRLFQRGLDPLEKNWQSFTFPTSSNPYIPAQEILDAKADLPEDVFRQEYLAEFLEESSGVFTNVDGCTLGEMLDPVTGATYILGWDPAKYEDFSVVTVLNMDTHHVDYWERFQHIEWEDQFELVSSIAMRYNHALIEMDATGVGDPLMEQLRKRNVSVNGIKFTNVKKEQYVRNLSLLLEHGDISFPAIKALTDELKDYEYHYTESRNLVYGAPAGRHDDCVTSLYLVAWRIQDSGEIAFTTSSISSLKEQGRGIPVVEELDDKFLMQRQEQVASSLRFLQSSGLF